jgi:LDH2 family malate/lactate/ureidoglycolate dehydrogenase
MRRGWNDMSSLNSRLERSVAAGRIPADDLKGLARDVFIGCGMPEPDAAVAAEVAVYAQLRGSDSHGVLHLPLYVAGLLDGTIKSAPRFAMSGALASARVLDADHGLGLVAGRRAIDEAIELATQFGLGAVAVRNSSHFGVAGYYADRAAERGLIGLAFSNAMPAMAAPGGMAPLLGTNPIAAAFPVPGRDTLVLDMATTIVARSRIHHAKAQGQAIPAGWALDPQGSPTTDPGEAIKGTVQPIGGPKGFGLGLMVELFCSALSDGQPGFEVTYEDRVKRPSGICQFFLVMNPAGFAGADRFGKRAAHIAGTIAATPGIAGAAPPRLPGDRGHAVERRARAEGIAVTALLRGALEKTARLMDGR